MQKHRDAKITLIVGKNGTGKSTFAKNLVEKVADRAVVVSYVGASSCWTSFPWIDLRDKEQMNTFKGVYHCAYAQYEEKTLEYLFKNLKRSWLIFDDCRDYLDARIDKDIYFRRILTHFRHHMLDPVFIAHAPPEIPRRVWAYNYTLWIGATDMKFDKSQIGSFSADKILSAQEQVNKLYSDAVRKNDGSHYGIFKWVVP